MSRKANTEYVIDEPGWYYEKRVFYRGWKIGLIELADSDTGSMYLYDENGRFRLHAQLNRGTARTDETEQMAKDTVDQMIAGTFPPTACE